jgi:hypothetical protein
VRRRLRGAARALRRLWYALLLPLLLVGAQHGALLHELGHHTGAQAQHAGDEPDGDTPCALCLAYAQVASAASAAPGPLPLLTALAFALAAEAGFRARPGTAPVPHNRGPPPRF